MSSRAQRRDARRRRNEARQEFQWRQGERRADQNIVALDRDAAEAEKILDDAENTLRKIDMRAAEDMKRADAAVAAKYAAEAKRLATQPRTIYAGATHGIRSVLVRHWAVRPPDDLAARLGMSGGSDTGGQIALLTDDGRMAKTVNLLSAAHPDIKAIPGFMDWVTETARVWKKEVGPKYAQLPKLRDDEWWRALCERLGLTITEDHPAEQVVTAYGTWERKLTLVRVPSLSRVDITRTGLRLTYRHRVGDSAKLWNAKLDGLRAGFMAVGLPAADAIVAQDSAANIVVWFNDKDPFSGTPPSGTFDDIRMRSLLGVTAQGDEAWIRWAGSSGLVVGGVPGSGKTASLLPLFAGMDGKCDLYVFDGKAGYDLHVLRHTAKVYDNSGNIDAPLETLRTLEVERTKRAERMYSEAGANNFWNLDPADRRRLGLRPQFVILDEVQTWTDTSGMNKNEKETAAEIIRLIRTLVQKGRSAGIVVVLTTQKPDAGTIPTVIRDNAALKIAFRVSTPEQATTVLGKQSPDAPDPTHIRQSTVGRCVMETEGHGVVLVQAGYTAPADLEAQLTPAGVTTQPAPRRAEAIPAPAVPATPTARPARDVTPELTREAAERAARVAQMTDAERAEAIRQIAVERGYLQPELRPDAPDAVPADQSPEPEAEPLAEAPAAEEPPAADPEPAGPPTRKATSKKTTIILDDGSEFSV